MITGSVIARVDNTTRQAGGSIPDAPSHRNAIRNVGSGYAVRCRNARAGIYGTFLASGPFPTISYAESTACDLRLWDNWHHRGVSFSSFTVKVPHKVVFDFTGFSEDRKAAPIDLVRI